MLHQANLFRVEVVYFAACLTQRQGSPSVIDGHSVDQIIETMTESHRRRAHLSLDASAAGAALAEATDVTEPDGIDLRQEATYWLSRLPPAYRMVLALYYLQGRRYREIAETMELPLGTVKTYLHRLGLPRRGSPTGFWPVPGERGS